MSFALYVIVMLFVSVTASVIVTFVRQHLDKSRRAMLKSDELFREIQYEQYQSTIRRTEEKISEIKSIEAPPKPPLLLDKYAIIDLEEMVFEPVSKWVEDAEQAEELRFYGPPKRARVEVVDTISPRCEFCGWETVTDFMGFNYQTRVHLCFKCTSKQRHYKNKD